MGWLDKLLGRGKKEAGPEGTYEAPAAPATDRAEPSYGGTAEREQPAEETPRQEDQP
jgi:hypothetical protein